MDEDGVSGSGLSGWAWHELGRQSEQLHQTQMNAASNFAARLRGDVPVDVGALLADNEALWQQNRALLQSIQDLQAEVNSSSLNYLELRRWADRADVELRRLYAERKAQGATSLE